MKRVLLGIVVCGAMGLGMLQLAGANSKAISDSATDATPDSLDVVAATAGHRGRRKLVHTVTVDGTLDASDPSRQILLQLNLDQDIDCENEFIWPPSGSSPIVRCGIGPGSKMGKITQVDADTLKFTFAKRVLGSPRKYKWRVITRDSVSDLADAAPDQNGTMPVWVKHRLR